MKVGILTLHDSPNYGALLQAYALRRFLSAANHEAQVIDRRRAQDVTCLKVRIPEVRPWKLFGLLAMAASDGAGEFVRRLNRTEEFLKTRVGLTPWRFHDWREAPVDLGFDAIVIGSDQVWNANNHDPAGYLPLAWPFHGQVVAYAASVGMEAFPCDLISTFSQGFAKLKAIGVREAETVTQVRQLGFSATQVVDPVLLADPKVWQDLGVGRADGRLGRIFAYFLAEDFKERARSLGAYAHETAARVDFFVDRFVLRYPEAFREWRSNRRFWNHMTSAGVDFRLDAGPEQFVQALAADDVVITNSYHALLFAIVFGKQVRVVLPTHPRRRQMNARLKEAAAQFVSGPCVFATLEEALESLRKGERNSVRTDAICAMRRNSAAWLLGNLV